MTNAAERPTAQPRSDQPIEIGGSIVAKSESKKPRRVKQPVTWADDLSKNNRLAALTAEGVQLRELKSALKARKKEIEDEIKEMLDGRTAARGAGWSIVQKTVQQPQKTIPAYVQKYFVYRLIDKTLLADSLAEPFGGLVDAINTRVRTRRVRGDPRRRRLPAPLPPTKPPKALTKPPEAPTPTNSPTAKPTTAAERVAPHRARLSADFLLN